MESYKFNSVCFDYINENPNLNYKKYFEKYCDYINKNNIENYQYYIFLKLIFSNNFYESKKIKDEFLKVKIGYYYLKIIIDDFYEKKLKFNLLSYSQDIYNAFIKAFKEEISIDSESDILNQCFSSLNEETLIDVFLNEIKKINFENKNTLVFDQTETDDYILIKKTIDLFSIQFLNYFLYYFNKFKPGSVGKSVYFYILYLVYNKYNTDILDVLSFNIVESKNYSDIYYLLSKIKNKNYSKSLIEIIKIKFKNKLDNYPIEYFIDGLKETINEIPYRSISQKYGGLLTHEYFSFDGGFTIIDSKNPCSIILDNIDKINYVPNEKLGYALGLYDGSNDYEIQSNIVEEAYKKNNKLIFEIKKNITNIMDHSNLNAICAIFVHEKVLQKEEISILLNPTSIDAFLDDKIRQYKFMELINSSKCNITKEQFNYILEKLCKKTSLDKNFLVDLISYIIQNIEIDEKQSKLIISIKNANESLFNLILVNNYTKLKVNSYFANFYCCLKDIIIKNSYFRDAVSYLAFNVKIDSKIYSLINSEQEYIKNNIDLFIFNSLQLKCAIFEINKLKSKNKDKYWLFAKNILENNCSSYFYLSLIDNVFKLNKDKILLFFNKLQNLKYYNKRTIISLTDFYIKTKNNHIFDILSCVLKNAIIIDKESYLSSILEMDETHLIYTYSILINYNTNFFDKDLKSKASKIITESTISNKTKKRIINYLNTVK